jgi:hypothetical protein
MPQLTEDEKSQKEEIAGKKEGSGRSSPLNDLHKEYLAGVIDEKWFAK